MPRSHFVICALCALLKVLRSPHVIVRDITDDSPSSRTEQSPEHRGCDRSAARKMNTLSELVSQDGSIAGPRLLIWSKSET